MRRKWVKLWVDECLEGTIRIELDPSERGIWYDIIILGGACRIPGTISANETTAYPHDYIANRLKVPLPLFESTLLKLKHSGRILENRSGIHILNWAKYQSEYERQKPYRQKKGEDPDKYVRGKYGHIVRR